MPIKGELEQKPGASEMIWGRMETQRQEPGNLRAKEGGSKEEAK